MAVVILGLPWLRCGTAEVFVSQLRFMREQRHRALFVVLPLERKHDADHPIWRRFAAEAGQLHGSPVVAAPLARRFRPVPLLGRLRAQIRNLTALDWSLRVSAAAPLGVPIKELLADEPGVVIIANHIYTMGFARKLKLYLNSLEKSCRIAIVTHDVQSHIVLDSGVPNPWTRRIDRFDALLATELRVLAEADALIHVSVADMRFFEARLPHRPHFLALPTVDRNVARAATQRDIDLLFVGSDHIANFHGLSWFFQSVLPLLGESPPAIRIVGRVDHIVRHRGRELWSRHRELFAGSVESTTPFYQRARAAIIPMRSGRGISVKTIEAAAHGIPIVGTTQAFRGMPLDCVTECGLRPHDTAEAFADAIRDALADGESLAMASRRLHERLFGWNAYASAMQRALEACTGSGSG